MDPTVRLKLRKLLSCRQSALTLSAPDSGPFVIIAAYIPLRSRLRAFFTASRASGKTMRRRFTNPHAAKGGDTSGLPLQGWSLEQKLSICHCTRVHVEVPTLAEHMDNPCGKSSKHAVSAVAVR